MCSASANAAFISGLGDPLTDPGLIGGNQEGFDAVADQVVNSITLGNVTYTGVDAPLTIGTDFNGSFNTTGGKSLFNDFDLVPAQFRFDFASEVDAFAFNWGAADNQWQLEVFNASDVLIESHIVPAVFFSNAGEYYAVAASGIKYAVLTDLKDNIAAGDYVFIDRFTTLDGEGRVELPAPATQLLMGLGLLGLGLTRRTARS